jgi:predicted O-linked N-acetylglucosamine transferase (SPINDLY family)
VQASWLDYFNTTGLAAMDAVIADDACLARPLALPFVERLVSVGPVRYPYEAPADAPPVPDTPASRPTTFGSFARLAKLCDTTWDAWAAAMRAVPGSRLVLKADALGDADVRSRVAAPLVARGIDAGRLEMRPASAHAAMLAEYGDVDIVLDTAPCNGGITTLEALWMGRPVVTIAGDTLVARQGVAILSAIGRAEWIARDAAGFAAIAARLASDRVALAREHAGLRERLAASPCCDAASFTARLEARLAQSLAERFSDS